MVEKSPNRAELRQDRSASSVTLGDIAVDEKSGPSPQQAGALARVLLAHARKPHWLRTSGHLASRLGVVNLAALDDLALMQIIHTFIRSAMSEAGPRAKTIVERICLSGEPRSSVAKALGISVRQVYRDQLRAVSYLASALVAGAAEPPASFAGARDVRSLAFSRAWMLSESGSSDSAQRLLTDVVSSSDDPVVKVRALSRLAVVALERDDPDLAQRHARDADDAAPALGDEASTYVAISVASIAAELGRKEDAARTAGRGVLAARRLLTAAESESAKELLVDALVTQGAIALEAGQPTLAHESALEGDRLVRTLRHPPLALQIKVGLVLGNAFIGLWANPRNAEMRLRSTLDLAVRNGALLSAAQACCDIAAVYGFKGNFQQSVAEQTVLLEEMQSMPTSSIKNRFLSQLALQLGYCGRESEALELLGEAAPKSAAARGRLSLVRALVRFHNGKLAEALDDCESSIDLCSQTEQTLEVGVGLVCKARLLSRLGRLSDAVSAAQHGVEVLKKSGHPENLRNARATLRRAKASLGRSALR